MTDNNDKPCPRADNCEAALKVAEAKVAIARHAADWRDASERDDKHRRAAADILDALAKPLKERPARHVGSAFPWRVNGSAAVTHILETARAEADMANARRQAREAAEGAGGGPACWGHDANEIWMSVSGSEYPLFPDLGR